MTADLSPEAIIAEHQAVNTFRARNRTTGERATVTTCTCGATVPADELGAHVVSRLRDAGHTIVPSRGVEYAPCYANESGDVFPIDTPNAVRKYAEQDVARLQEEEGRHMGVAANRFFVGERPRVKWVAAAASPTAQTQETPQETPVTSDAPQHSSDSLTPWVDRINKAVRYSGHEDREDVRSILREFAAAVQDGE